GFFGVYYFNRDQDILSSGAYSYFGDDESTSVAVYGETSFMVSNDVNIVVGGRLEKESQDRHFVFGAIDSILDQDTNIFLPKLVFQYAWTPDTTLSISARKGYNAAGGALNFAAGEYYFFDEERVNTYELSSRTQLENGFLNANIFYNDYEGFQALSTARSIVNMPEVTTYGAELEYNTILSEDIELNVGVGLLQSNIEDAGDIYSVVDGNELDSAPSFNASLGARYWFNDQFNFGASARYVGEYFGDFTNTSERVAGDYTLVRINASYTADEWLFTAYIDNVFDETAIITKEPAGAFYESGYAAIADPRNVGVSATYRF
ncbi:MAG: TonB-dependent receptor, partial [Paraglaciecola sp.]|uniref:TonB-dependent receptor domain-containing protein n=1 Tax=Paraglaciecola sp. TaxID=1920173 RepID=UPI0032967EBD